MSNTDLNNLKQTMLLIIETANKVIAETESENPNEIVICDLAIERMEELFILVNFDVFGHSSVIKNDN